MVKAKPKCKLDGQISEHWFASKCERLYELLYELLYEYLNVGVYKGQTGLSPPVAYLSTVENRHI
jgi:hypothetical protein